MVQTLRSGFRVLLQRPKYKGVHNLVPANALYVPPFVLQHIAKGGKFIPTSKLRSIPICKDELEALRRRLLLRKFFPVFSRAVPKCRLRSAWQPPPDKHVDAFMRLLRGELVDYEASKFCSNLSWLDRKAQGWLRQHADMVSVIDCDKGLGDALVLRSWMHGQICKQLRQGYVQLSPAAFQSRMSDFKHQADALFQFFLSSGAIAKADVDFLLSKFSLQVAGTFRILAKVHKVPISSRPICNLRGTWIAPLATFLVESLNPLVSQLHSVVISTDQLLEELRSLHCLHGMVFVTLDVVNLYPSVDRCHFLETVAGFLRKHVPAVSFCTFLIRLLELVLEACVVTYDGEFFASYDGIPTGLAVASIAANIYLWHLDLYMESKGGNNLQVIRRYIDDLLVLWDGSSIDLLDLANTWHPSLRFEQSGIGNVTFLDVQLCIEDDRSVSWALFNKPQNLHLYVPASSNHPSCTFKSLQLGGFLRIHRRNRFAADLNKNLVAFKQRLKDRGFSVSEFDSLIRRYQRKAPKVQNPYLKQTQVYLKLPFHKGIRAGWLQAKLRKHLPLLNKAVADVNVGLCWSVGKNMFRRRYGQVWKFNGHRCG